MNEANLITTGYFSLAADKFADKETIMKPFLVKTVIVVSIIYILTFISINFIFKASLIGFLEKRLSASFDAKINIRNFKTDLLTQVNISQIQINRTPKKPAFLLALSSFNFKYSPLSLFRGRFKGKIEFKDLSLEAPSLSYPDFGLKDMRLNFESSKGKGFGDFSIGVLNYNKLTLNTINSKILLSDKKFYFKDLEADTFKGKLEGDMTLSFSPKIAYELSLKMVGFNLKELTKTLAPPDWQATGIISGDLKVRVEAEELKDLQGRFYSSRPGTVDMNVIKRLLSRTKVIIDKKIFEKDIISYENLTGDISLHKNEIIVELHLIAKEIDLIFEIKIEPQVLTSLLRKNVY